MDPTYNKGSLKFVQRFDHLSYSQQSSAFHTFGSSFLQRGNRGKIKVQPTAVTRRKSKIGSRQKQDTYTAKSVNNLSTRKVSLKRPHSFKDVVRKNQACAKKAGRSMASYTTYPTKKISSVKVDHSILM